MDFRLSDQAEYGNNAKTHKGFTGYLFGTHKRDVKERTYLKRIIASVNEAMEEYPEYKVYITGYVHHRSLSLPLSTCVYILLYCISLHTYTVPNLYYVSHSLGGGLASLFAFHLAHMKKQNQNVCKNFVKRITAVTWAAPIVGNAEFAKMYNTLEEEGYLRQ